MLIDLKNLVADFAAAAGELDIAGWPCSIGTELLAAPHRQPRLPNGHGAVYVFALSAEAGEGAPAGPGAVLKVGRSGPKSAARFASQHYLPNSAKSTLAGSLLRYPIMWPWLGIERLDAAAVRPWMLSTDVPHISVTVWPPV